MATHVPPASGPSHHDAPSSGEFASAGVGEDDWEHVHSWSRRVSSPERLRDELEHTHTKITQLREIIDFSRARGRAPPDHYYRDLDILHAEYDQLGLALEESREAFASSHRGRSPAAAPRPPCPDSSSHTGLHLSPQRFASQDRRRPRDASGDLSRHSSFSEERSRERFAARDQPIDRRRFASRDSPSPKLRRFASGDSPSPKRRRFASEDFNSPQRRHSSRASSGDGSLERPPSRSLLPVHLRLLGKIKTLMNLLYLPRFGL